MHVVAVHTISDPDRFFSSVQEGMRDMPEGFRVQSVMPSGDGSKAVCLWEAESVDSVRDLVDDRVGDSSKNEFYEVDSQNAVGMPG